jgi:hypothetical protein
MNWKRLAVIAVLAPAIGFGLGKASGPLADILGGSIGGGPDGAAAATAGDEAAGERRQGPSSDDLEVVDLGQFVVPVVPRGGGKAYLLAELRLGFDRNIGSEHLVALRPSLRHLVLEEFFELSDEGWLDASPIDIAGLSERLRQGVAANLPEGPEPRAVFFDRLMVQPARGA